MGLLSTVKIVLVIMITFNQRVIVDCTLLIRGKRAARGDKTSAKNKVVIKRERGTTNDHHSVKIV